MSKSLARFQHRDFSTSTSFDQYDLIINTNIFTESSRRFQNIFDSLAEGCFIFTIEKLANVPNEGQLKDLNLELISKYPTEIGVCLLIRKVNIAIYYKVVTTPRLFPSCNFLK